MNSRYGEYNDAMCKTYTNVDTLMTIDRFDTRTRYIAVLDSVNGITIHKVRIVSESDDKNYLRRDKLYDLEILINDEIKIIKRIPESKLAQEVNDLYKSKDVYNKGTTITYSIPEDIVIKDIDKFITSKEEDTKISEDSIDKTMQFDNDCENSLSNNDYAYKKIKISNTILNHFNNAIWYKLYEIGRLEFNNGEYIDIIHYYSSSVYVVTNSKDIVSLLKDENFNFIKTKIEIRQKLNKLASKREAYSVDCSKLKHIEKLDLKVIKEDI